MSKSHVLSIIILAGYLITGMTEEINTPIMPQDNTNITVGLQWESRYVSEGRDNLDTAGIQTVTMDIYRGDLNLAIWNGWGYDSGYHELQVTPALTHEWNNFDIYLYYNYKRYFEEHKSENEIGSGIFYYGLPHHLFAGVDWYYSVENDGSFFRLSLGSRFNPIEKLELEPAIMFGINENYIPDGHDGANHVGIQLNGKYEISGKISIVGYLGYNVAIDRDPGSFAGDILLRDFFWSGIGIEAAF